MPQYPINTLHCLILQSKMALKEIPQGVVHYFINSKRRFFVYFKSYVQMVQTMKNLSKNNTKFYRRESLLPDREQLQEYVYHCNYRFKRQDLRKNLYHTTPYNQPKVHFDKYQRARNREQPEGRQGEVLRDQQSDMVLQSKVSMGQSGGARSEWEDQGARDKAVNGILMDRELLKKVFQALNLLQ